MQHAVFILAPVGVREALRAVRYASRQRGARVTLQHTTWLATRVVLIYIFFFFFFSKTKILPFFDDVCVCVHIFIFQYYFFRDLYLCI